MHSLLIIFILLLISLAPQAATQPIYTIEGNTLTYYSVDNQEPVFEIPTGITALSSAAFRDQWENPVLEKITIPSSVTSIPDAFHEGCLESLAVLEVSESNNAYRSEDGVLYSKDGETLLCYPPKKSATTYTVPYGVKTLSPWCFRDCWNLQQVVLPSSLETIGSGAFYDCRNLKVLYIPADIQFIGKNAFRRWQESVPYIIIYQNQYPDSNSENPYGAAAQAENTTVFFSDTAPDDHFDTQISEGTVLAFTLLPGWNFCYLPENTPEILQKNLFSYSAVQYDPEKQCYIKSTSILSNNFYWFYNSSESTNSYYSILTTKQEFSKFPLKDYQNESSYLGLRLSSEIASSGKYWCALSQRFLPCTSNTTLPVLTPIFFHSAE